MHQKPPAAYDRKEPCARCPYRRDAPLGKWHPDHFVDLLASDASPLGSVYLCHNHDGNICAGWALDQRERDVPSVMLRLHLARDPRAAAQFRELGDGGHALYGSVQEMCVANLESGGDDEGR